VLVSPKVNGAPLSDGSKRKADGQLAGTPSQLFDAVAVVVSEDGCAALLKEAAAVQFVMDAFGHLKAIGASAEAQPLLDKAGVQKDKGVTTPDGSFVSAAKRRFYDREPAIRMLA
jgi:catalase